MKNFINSEANKKILLVKVLVLLQDMPNMAQLFTTVQMQKQHLR